MNTDLSRLAAKQKRLQSWVSFMEQEVSEPQLRRRMSKSLQEFQEALASCWKNGGFDDQDLLKISSLERTLEQLNEEARLRPVA